MKKHHLTLRYFLTLVIVFFTLQTFLISQGKKSRPAAARKVAGVEWLDSAKWYNIVIDRFRNGEKRNDPRNYDIFGAYPPGRVNNWAPKGFTEQWYRREMWTQYLEPLDFYRLSYLRRFGGDLQGILDKLTYLQEMGVNTILLSPINESPSSTKQDARLFHHLDVTFGNDAAADRNTARAENRNNPNQILPSLGDSTMLTVIEEAGRYNIRVVLTLPWRYVNSRFWAWQDVIEKQEKSKFVDWFDIKQFDNPKTTGTFEFSYESYPATPGSIMLKTINGNYCKSLKEHLFLIAKRHLDFNGDGKTNDGVDGFALDDIDLMPSGFVAELRALVKSINPNACVIGLPSQPKNNAVFIDEESVVKSKIVDRVASAQWFKAFRSFLKDTTTVTSMSVVKSLRDLVNNSISITGGIGLSRPISSLAWSGEYLQNESPKVDSSYPYRPAQKIDIARMKLVLSVQTFLKQAPLIFYGDEVGSFGGYYQEELKPMLWDELSYEEHSFSPSHQVVDTMKVAVSKPLLNWFQKSWFIRDSIQGMKTLDFPATGNDNILALRRSDGKTSWWLVINRSSQQQVCEILEFKNPSIEMGEADVSGKTVVIKPLSSCVFVER